TILPWPRAPLGPLVASWPIPPSALANRAARRRTAVVTRRPAIPCALTILPWPRAPLGPLVAPRPILTSALSRWTAAGRRAALVARRPAVPRAGFAPEARLGTGAGARPAGAVLTLVGAAALRTSARWAMT